VYNLNCAQKRTGSCITTLRPRTWRLLHEFFVKNYMITTDHPSYSPDLAPCDFFLFPKVKTIMPGEHLGMYITSNVKRGFRRT
jgi:hypothetical protein